MYINKINNFLPPVINKHNNRFLTNFLFCNYNDTINKKNTEIIYNNTYVINKQHTVIIFIICIIEIWKYIYNL